VTGKVEPKVQPVMYAEPEESIAMAVAPEYRPLAMNLEYWSDPTALNFADEDTTTGVDAHGTRNICISDTSTATAFAWPVGEPPKYVE